MHGLPRIVLDASRLSRVDDVEGDMNFLVGGSWRHSIFACGWLEARNGQFQN